MNKDQLKGRIKEIKGTIKEAAGKAFGNKELQNKGMIEKAAGNLQADYGNLKKDISKES